MLFSKCINALLKSKLLKIKVLKRFFRAMPQKNHFGSTKNHLVKGSLKNYFCLTFYCTFFRHKEPLVKQKGSLDVKGSLWNLLDKKGFFIWHHIPSNRSTLPLCKALHCNLSLKIEDELKTITHLTNMWFLTFGTDGFRPQIMNKIY